MLTGCLAKCQAKGKRLDRLPAASASMLLYTPTFRGGIGERPLTVTAEPRHCVQVENYCAFSAPTSCHLMASEECMRPIEINRTGQPARHRLVYG